MNANNNAVQMNDDIENYLPIEGVHRFFEFDFDKED
jgi:hypothetical protein